LFFRRVNSEGSTIIPPHYLAFDPATIEKRQVYRLLTGAVVPRPIGWASTVSKSGVSNLAPFSFFTVVCIIPPMISLTIARNPDGTEKHTLKNVRETGEFCFNVVTEQVWREMVDSANAFPATDSEFSKTGLTPIPSVNLPPQLLALIGKLDGKPDSSLEAKGEGCGSSRQQARG
jgi:flavin reductase (DIM6/NTAB) family NADH-FMN oxidoreductase RutF